MLASDHKEQRLKEFESQYELLSEKLHRLKKERIIETDASSLFKLDKRIEEVEQNLNKLYVQLVRQEVRQLDLQAEVAVEERDFLKIPEKLWDRYEKLDFLGRGGLAEVYKVQNRRVNSIVALKILLPRFQHDPQMIARFWAEGKIIGALSSAGRHAIVSVRTMGCSADDAFFIEMDYVPGKTLDAVLQACGRYAPNIVLRLLQQLAGALQHAHAHRIIHRDVKPQNIIVDENNRLTLMDFGIAKRLDTTSIVSLSGAFYGTYQYAAPEQFDPTTFGAVSERTDIYALGILGYQLLTNCLPFEGTHLQLMFRHCSQGLPAFPAEVVAFIAKCTQKQQADRFQDMQAVTDALDAILQQEAIEEYRERFAPFAGLAELTPKQRKILEDDRKRLGLIREIAAQIEHEFPLPYKAGDEWTEPLTGMEFVWIPPGKFMMGATETDKTYLIQEDVYWDNTEVPRHEVHFQVGFWLGKYPVTQAQWLAIMGNNPSRFKGDNHPVEQVSWDDAQKFIEKLNAVEETGRSPLQYRLSSEAEWEYACRAGSETLFCFGNDVERLKEYAWYKENSNGQTHPVGQLQPNAWGVYDMHGNVSVWCADVGHGNYQGAPTDGSVWTDSGGRGRVVRGGSLVCVPPYVRSAYRPDYMPSYRRYDIGFRLLRTM